MFAVVTASLLRHQEGGGGKPQGWIWRWAERSSSSLLEERESRARAASRRVSNGKKEGGSPPSACSSWEGGEEKRESSAALRPSLNTFLFFVWRVREGGRRKKRKVLHLVLGAGKCKEKKERSPIPRRLGIGEGGKGPGAGLERPRRGGAAGAAGRKEKMASTRPTLGKAALAHGL